MAVSIDPCIAELRRFGAKDVDDYEKKLRSFGTNERKLIEFLAEGRAALLFLRNGADSGEAERCFRREAERYSGLKPNTIGA